MKVSLKKSLVHLGLIGTCLFSCQLAKAELPIYITFSNDTALSLATSIAGLPGQGISPNTTKSAVYSMVGIGCYYANAASNCPIEFTDRSNGARVATVYINAETATLTRAPQFFGSYGDEYEVTGWETSPISHISIVKKIGSTQITA